MGELGSVAMCKRIFKEQTTEQGDVPFYKIGTFGGTPDAFISRELFDEYQRLYQFPKVGDILISAAGTIGRTIVYQGDPAYYQDSNIVWLQHDERLDNGFLLQFLNGKSWSSLEGSTLKRLYNKDLLNAEIATPSPNEQHQIGSTFAKLDDIITLHQRKRCNGPFMHPLVWEQRKLGELMDVASVRRVHQEDWTDEGVRFLRARDLVAFAKNESIEDPLFISSEMYKEYSAQSGKVSVGDLLVTGVGTIGVPWLVTSDNPVYFKDGNIIWFKNRHSIDGGFFYHSFTASAIQNYINEAAGIGTVGTYTIETGKKTPIWLPSRQEQREIAAMMTHLDTLITLHQ